jgi:RNA polymerase sigma factor (TIGR02999 family)
LWERFSLLTYIGANVPLETIMGWPFIFEYARYHEAGRARLEERKQSMDGDPSSTPPLENPAHAPKSEDVSGLLQAWGAGDGEALNRLTPIVYEELHRLAHIYMQRERPGHSLQASALVNEAYMRLVNYKRMHWQDRAHFFAVSSQLMRRILVEHARRHNLKRGGNIAHVSLEESALVPEPRDAGLVMLDEAINTLATFDPRKAQVVEMRFFGGMSVEETAQALKVSSITVMRDWDTAKAWLYRELSSETNHGSASVETDR